MAAIRTFLQIVDTDLPRVQYRKFPTRRCGLGRSSGTILALAPNLGSNDPISTRQVPQCVSSALQLFPPFVRTASRSDVRERKHPSRL